MQCVPLWNILNIYKEWVGTGWPCTHAQLQEAIRMAKVSESCNGLAMPPKLHRFLVAKICGEGLVLHAYMNVLLKYSIKLLPPHLPKIHRLILSHTWKLFCTANLDICSRHLVMHHTDITHTSICTLSHVPYHHISTRTTHIPTGTMTCPKLWIEVGLSFAFPWLINFL